MLIALIAAATTVAGPTTKPVDCPNRGGVFEAKGTPQGKAEKLGELPPANLVLTLYREVDRCPAPVIVRYGIGAPGR